MTSLECCPSPKDDNKKPTKTVPHWIQPVVLAIFGGFNNGYNLIVVAEILLQLRSQKILITPTQEGIFVASINLGIILMMPLGAYLADKYGRLRTVVIGESVVVLASLSQIFCNNAVSLTLARIAVGFGMSLCVLLKPLFIAEISDPKHRGKMMTLFSLCFSLGVFVVAVLGNAKNTVSWRTLLGMGAVPSLILVIAAQFYLTESPVWLNMVSHKPVAFDDDEARGLTTDKVNKDRIESTQNKAKQGKCSSVFFELFDKSNGIGQMTFIGILIGLMLVLDGLWLLITYRNDVFTDDQHYWAILLCTVLLVINIPIMLLVDKIGRKKLVVVGVIGSVLARLMGVILFAINVEGWISNMTLIVYAIFAQIINAVGYAIVSELYGARHRSVGMCFIFLIILTLGLFLSLIYKQVELIIGNQGWFLIFLIMQVIIGVPLILKLPETKGKEIE